jgi:hypothetical protein
MIINWTKGKKGEGDRIINLTTSEKEWFSIYKLALLSNQLAINEWKINGDKIKATGRFLFRNAIESAIEMAELGYDWADEENMQKVKDWCKEHWLKFEKIEPELRKVYQTKLKDFSNGL